MSKQTSQIVSTGNLEGVRLTIKKIHNQGLQESVSIRNQGTVAQPMSGWVLASMRGQLFYKFPDSLIFLPGMTVVVHSGQGQVRNSQIAQVDLFWTNEQVWNNRGDMAILFDAEGIEIDRYIYPHERVMGTGADHQKMLVRNSDDYQVIDAPVHQPDRSIRHRNTSKK